MINLYNLCTDFIKIIDMALPPRDPRHQYLRFEGLEYTNADITDFEERLSRIYSRGIHRMLVLDFESLPAMMSERFTSRMLMEHRDDQGQKSARYISDKGDLSAYWRRISFKGNFLGTPPSYTHIRDPILRMDLLVQSTSFIFLLAKLVRLQICEELDNTWASVSPVMESSRLAMMVALEVTEDAHVVDEGALAVPAPVQAPLPPPADGPARTMA
ncbi:hypothetical protein Tco_0744621 [Tanacetum coccineum]